MVGSRATNNQAVQFEQQQAAQAQQQEADRQARLQQGQSAIDAIFNGTTDPTTGKTTGGFGQDFYNNYTQQQLNYYQPQEQQQYNQAKQSLLYNLNDAGTLNSSAAADQQGLLAQQDALQKAAIVSNANTQTGQLQNQIQSNKQAALNELYSTEDPTLATNLASDSAKASQLQDPTLTPSAALFSPALTAAGSTIQSYMSPYALYGNPYGTGTQQASVAPAGQSTGTLN